MIQHEMTMTRICQTCGDQYGKWRRRCPACGSETPASDLATFNTPRLTVAAPPVRKKRAGEARRSQTECVFCQQRGAKEKCPTCDELIHKYCMPLHRAACEQFQAERATALNALGGGTNEHPSHR